jgi:hypothetical protein
LQSLGVAGIELIAGKIRIDTSGNMVSEGSITVKKVNIDESDDASKSIGDVVVSAGATHIDIDSAALTANSHIFVTPERPVAVAAVKKDSNTFTIILENAPASSLKVHWWIVN